MSFLIFSLPYLDHSCLGVFKPRHEIFIALHHGNSCFRFSFLASLIRRIDFTPFFELNDGKPLLISNV
jgi:hypothetical protein